MLLLLLGRLCPLAVACIEQQTHTLCGADAAGLLQWHTVACCLVSGLPSAAGLKKHFQVLLMALTACKCYERHGLAAMEGSQAVGIHLGTNEQPQALWRSCSAAGDGRRWRIYVHCAAIEAGTNCCVWRDTFANQCRRLREVAIEARRHELARAALGLQRGQVHGNYTLILEDGGRRHGLARRKRWRARRLGLAGSLPSFAVRCRGRRRASANLFEDFAPDETGCDPPILKISTQNRTHANKPRNEHTNADTIAHTS